MPYYPPPFEGSAIKYQYVNTEASPALTSGLLGTAKTPFALTPAAVIPESSAVIGGVARIEASGLFGTGVLALSQTVSVQMAGQDVATFSFTPVANLGNMAWEFDLIATILASGKVEVRGNASFGTALTSAVYAPIRNLDSFTMSTAGGVPVTVSNQFGGVSVGGTITLRQLVIQVT